MYYTPLDPADIQLGQKLACTCKVYANIQTGTATYIGKHGITLTDGTSSIGILYRNFDFNKEVA